VLEGAARGLSPVRIERFLLFVDMLDNALLVDHESRAIREAVLRVKDTVVLGDRPLKITEQGKLYANLISIDPIGKLAVDADSKNLGPGLLEFGDISLIRL